MWGQWLDKWYLFVQEKYSSFGCAFGVLEAQFKLEWEEHNLDCLSAHQAVHCHSGKKHKWDVSQQHHNQVLFFFLRADQIKNSQGYCPLNNSLETYLIWNLMI